MSDRAVDDQLMTGEEKKRLHRCCFAGHRPEKITATEREVKYWLNSRIDKAMEDGCVTFITGCGMGVDLWAAQIVYRKRSLDSGIHLICAIPWPGFAAKWKREWKQQYDLIVDYADLRVNISDRYYDGVFRKRNEWMVNRSARLIAFWNGDEGGTAEMIRYAREQELDISYVREKNPEDPFHIPFSEAPE